MSLTFKHLHILKYWILTKALLKILFTSYYWFPMVPNLKMIFREAIWSENVLAIFSWKYVAVMSMAIIFVKFIAQIKFILRGQIWPNWQTFYKSGGNCLGIIMISHHHNIAYHTKIKSVLKGFCLSDTILSIIWKQATFSLIDSIIILIKKSVQIT